MSTLGTQGIGHRQAKKAQKTKRTIQKPPRKPDENPGTHEK